MAVTQIAIAQRNAELDGGKANWDSGYLRLYDGTKPTHVEDAITGTKLAELRFNATAFPNASGGTRSANALTADSSADNTGTATHWRAFKSDGTTPIAQGDVTATGGGGSCVLDNTSITQGVNVSISSFSDTVAEG